jgi:hypothetical protein
MDMGIDDDAEQRKKMMLRIRMPGGLLKRQGTQGGGAGGGGQGPCTAPDHPQLNPQLMWPLECLTVVRYTVTAAPVLGRAVREEEPQPWLCLCLHLPRHLPCTNAMPMPLHLLAPVSALTLDQRDRCRNTREESAESTERGCRECREGLT